MRDGSVLCTPHRMSNYVAANTEKCDFETVGFHLPYSYILVTVQHPAQGSLKLLWGATSYILHRRIHKKIGSPFI